MTAEPTPTGALAPPKQAIVACPAHGAKPLNHASHKRTVAQVFNRLSDSVLGDIIGLFCLMGTLAGLAAIGSAFYE